MWYLAMGLRQESPSPGTPWCTRCVEVAVAAWVAVDVFVGRERGTGVGNPSEHQQVMQSPLEARANAHWQGPAHIDGMDVTNTMLSLL